MCLIAFAINASDQWPLIIASNRDEFLNRPTLPLARWQTASGQDIISGRDLRAGGTWMGITPGGRVAFLTNVREAQPQVTEKSRGELAMRWLEGDMGAAQFMAQTESHAYGGCNLVLGDFQRGSWVWLTNKAIASDDQAASPGSSSVWRSRMLEPGIYGLSNAALDTPWPKTRALKEALKTAVSAPDLLSLEAPLWSALANRQRASDADLPITGVPLALEQALSSAFVDYPEYGYGTRCSTVLVASMPAVLQGVMRWDVSMQEKIYPRPDVDEPMTGHSAEFRERACAVQWQQLGSITT
jgi:uncharacterized protein with NRDE domain